MSDQAVPLHRRAHEHVKHVKALLANLRNHGKPDPVALSPSGQVPGIRSPDPAPTLLNIFASFQLSTQERSQKIRGKEARTDVHPGIFVHLTAKETAAIGAFFAQDLG